MDGSENTMPLTPTQQLKQKIEQISNIEIRQALLNFLNRADALQRGTIIGETLGNTTGSIMRNALNDYVLGWFQQIPTWLEDDINDLRKEDDPEFKEYVRLYTKFGGMAPPSEKKQSSVLKAADKGDVMKGFV